MSHLSLVLRKILRTIESFGHIYFPGFPNLKKEISFLRKIYLYVEIFFSAQNLPTLGNSQYEYKESKFILFCEKFPSFINTFLHGRE